QRNRERDHRQGAVLLVFLYAVASVYSLRQMLLGTTQFASLAIGHIVLSCEIVIGLIMIACLVWLGGREYLLALGLVVLHVTLGAIFAQWQSPALWVAIAVMLYLLRPSMRNRYVWMGLRELRADIARYRSGVRGRR